MEPNEKYLKAKIAAEEIEKILQWVETNPIRRFALLDLDGELSERVEKPVKSKRFAKLEM